MPSIARMGDSVLSPNGTGYHCQFPMETSILEANSNNVYCNGILVAVEGNMVAPHPLPGCSTIDQQTVSSFSSTVKIGGKGVARIGDSLGDNVITQGSPNAFAGG
jgi:uncharacterized Zn-binding protein involved in type VI secretion